MRDLGGQAGSVQARKRPQAEGDALGGGPTKVFRPNPTPLRVLGRRRRGGHVGGAWEEGSIKVALPPCRAAPLGCSATTQGACFIDPYQHVPTNAETQRSYPDCFVRRNRRLSKAEKCPKLEPLIEFSVGASSHELAKHLDFTVHRSCANLPRTPLRTFHQLLFLPRRSALPNPC